MLKQLFLVMFISLTASAFAQGINTGGGGPDGRNQQKMKMISMPKLNSK